MRYADEQIVRPRQEHGCDYGAGRRRVLVRKGEKDLLYCEGAKHWGGNGCDWQYSPCSVETWDDDLPIRELRQRDLCEGRMTPARWAAIAEAVYDFFGTRFPIELISLHHTLLLDAPGEVHAPPERPRAAPKDYPKFAGDRLYRIVSRPVPGNEDREELLIREYRIVKQSKGMVDYESTSGRALEWRHSHKHLVDQGFAETPEAAAAYDVDRFAADVSRAKSDLELACKRLGDAEAQLRTAKALAAEALKKHREETAS